MATMNAIGAAMAGPTFNNLGGSLAAGTASYPDVVGNLRVDQAWGSFQVAAALHDVSAGYYGATEGTGHPDDAVGGAVSAGIKLNAPMVGPGDYFQGVVIYSEGAFKYASYSGCAGSNVCDFYNGNSFGFGFAQDAVFDGAGSSIQLTTAWSVMASYEHFWTPNLRTSIYGSYLDVSYNATATGFLCTLYITPAGTPCNPNWQTWSVGSRSQWDITKGFYVGVDVIYSRLQTALLNGGAPVFVPAGSIFLPAGKNFGLYTTDDQEALSVTARVQRDILP
jgi:hypothetical protein